MATTAEITPQHGTGSEVLADVNKKEKSPDLTVDGNEQQKEAALSQVTALLKPGAMTYSLMGPEFRLWDGLMKKNPDALRLAQVDPAHPDALLKLLNQFRKSKFLELSSLISLIEKCDNNAQTAAEAVKTLLQVGLKPDRVTQLMVKADFPWTHVSELLHEQTVARYVKLHNAHLLSNISEMGADRFTQLDTAFQNVAFFKGRQDSQAYFQAVVFYGERFADLPADQVATKAYNAVVDLTAATLNEIDEESAFLIISRSSDYNGEKVGLFLKEIRTNLPDFYEETKNFSGLGVLTIFPLTEKDSLKDVTSSIKTLLALGFTPDEICRLAQARRQANEVNDRVAASFLLMTKDIQREKVANPKISFLELSTVINFELSGTTAIDGYDIGNYVRMTDTREYSAEEKRSYVESLRKNSNFSERPDLPVIADKFMQLHGTAADIVAVYESALAGGIPLNVMDYYYNLLAVKGLVLLSSIINDLNTTALSGRDKYELLSELVVHGENAEQYFNALKTSTLKENEWASFLAKHNVPLDQFAKMITSQQTTTLLASKK